MAFAYSGLSGHVEGKSRNEYLMHEIFICQYFSNLQRVVCLMMLPLNIEIIVFKQNLYTLSLRPGHTIEKKESICHVSLSIFYKNKKCLNNSKMLVFKDLIKDICLTQSIDNY